VALDPQVEGRKMMGFTWLNQKKMGLTMFNQILFEI
jgi:hypothetical protein